MSTTPGDHDSHTEVVKALLQAQDLGARLATERSEAWSEAEHASQRATEVEDSIAFRLGSLLLDAVRSPRGVLALPGSLASLLRHWRARGKDSDGEVAIPGAHGDEKRVTLPGADLVRSWHLRHRPEPPATLAQFRVAAVVDPFTHAGFAPDCTLLNLRAGDLEQQIDGFQPHVLFVESAWRGQDGDWTHKVSPCSGELMDLVDMCRRRAIPTIFWCKEDPAHFDDFIAAAALFDHVFTTDADCVERYRAKLGHDRVGVLGFACQPAIHNPVETGERRVAASFAGSWYAKYPERARDFDALVECVQQALPVEIYDRNHDRGDPAFEYPERYRPLIRKGVPYDRINEVYKACEFAITVNTVTTSSTMFARRTHELLACNTITISNRSTGIDRAYGDLVLMAERDDLGERLAHLRDSQDARHRLRLRGLREVMTHHTAALRLARVAEVSTGPLAPTVPVAWVLARVESRDECDRLVDMFLAQRQERKQLLMMASPRLGIPDGLLPGTIRVIADTDGDQPIADLVPDDAWIAPWHAGDHYGPCYLLDLMLATRYSDAQVVGKSTHFAMSDGVPRLEPGAPPYSADARLSPRRALLRSALACRSSLRGVLDDLDGQIGPPLHGLTVDEFGYCRHGAGQPAAAMADVD